MVWFYNVILRHAWQDFLERERYELLNTRNNTTTSYWETTGFFPFNPNPEAWKNVLSSLGGLNNKMRKGKNERDEREYEIQVKTGASEATLTK